MEDDESAEQYQKKMRKRVADAIKGAQLEERKKEVLRRFFDDAAFERLMNIRLSNKELYDQMVNLVVQWAQTNRISGKISESQLMRIIQSVTSRREPTIEFKRK